MAVEFPHRREDVLNGLEALSDEPVTDGSGHDPRWPDLRNAVHWVVDDTAWDDRPAASDVGTLLVDHAEAEAVAAVVSLVVRVSQRQGPTGTDVSWFADAEWPQVREAAKQAAALLRANDR